MKNFKSLVLAAMLTLGTIGSAFALAIDIYICGDEVTFVIYEDGSDDINIEVII